MPKLTPFSDDELTKMYATMLAATPWQLRPPHIERGEARRTVVCAGRHRDKDRDKTRPFDALVVITEKQVLDSMGASAWEIDTNVIVVGASTTLEGRALIAWLYQCWRLGTETLHEGS